MQPPCSEICSNLSICNATTSFIAIYGQWIAPAIWLSFLNQFKSITPREVVVAQLVERSLPIPEVHGSNPVIGKNLFIHWTFVYCQLCIEKTKIKEKRPGMAHFFKKSLLPYNPPPDWCQVCLRECTADFEERQEDRKFFTQLMSFLGKNCTFQITFSNLFDGQNCKFKFSNISIRILLLFFFATN